MSNLANQYSWQPLTFKDFSNDFDENIFPAVNDIADFNHQQELESLKNEASEKGFQEGIILGKEEGYAAGQTKGYEEGYKQGIEEGQKQIHLALKTEIEEQKMVAVQAITDLVANFQNSIKEMDEKVIPKLVDLAMLAAQKMVDSLPKNKHKQLTKIVEGLLIQNPPVSEIIELHVNPDDVLSIETLLVDQLAQYSWKLVTDPTIESGGCKVISDQYEVDATVGSRWQVITDVVKRDNE